MTEEKAPIQRQFVNFAFYKVRPEWWLLDPLVRESEKEKFLKVVQSYSSKLILIPYTTLGIRADCDLMIWRIGLDLNEFEKMSGEIHKAGFGKYLLPAYSYLSMTKRSVYIDKLDPSHQESRAVIKPGKDKYIFVYPFVKTRAWYLLPQEERQTMMDEHIRIGAKYTSVKLNTSYSFGLDDQDFVVAFESDEPADFLDLVMELRNSQGSRFTERDTPIFTCLARPYSDWLKSF